MLGMLQIYRDCCGLIERVRNRVSDWKNKFLSFAGRLQLVQSVLSSMHVYWATMSMLPDGVIKEIEQVLRNFLWSQGSLQKGKSKVAWDVVCLSKNEGGLGIRSLHDFNIALLSVGNGRSTSAWYDNWCDFSPLITSLSPGMITNAGFTLNACVGNIVSNEAWSWPNEWSNQFPNLAAPSLVNNVANKWVWSDVCGFTGNQPVHIDWESILAAIIPESKKKTIDIIVMKLILAATSYFIWQERNARLFRQEERPVHKLTEIIIATVHMKLISMKFKNNSKVLKHLETWKIPLGMLNLA
uniref:uncharacterized protein LOC122608979 n=1 Tax=Erigeron canadensis TaxID=72917 RepID=UPI001CB8A994|nr:uncharacterized protein LOC122608979 [Erigeron canadensis]